MDKLLIIGCSNRKIKLGKPLPAIQLYQGGVVPEIRKIVENNSRLINNIYILSGKYGGLKASEEIEIYDYQLTLERALELSNSTSDLIFEIVRQSKINEILIIVEPVYLIMIKNIFAMENLPRVFWEPQISALSDFSKMKLKEWNWI